MGHTTAEDRIGWESSGGTAAVRASEAEAHEARAALIDLLAQAQESGQADNYVGKRRFVRYAFHPRVEVRFASEDEESALIGSLRDISRGGLSIWAPVTAKPGDRLAVRVWPRSRPPVWIPVTVEHYREGVGGVLLGASFGEPLPSDGAERRPPANAPASDAADASPARSAFRPDLSESIRLDPRDAVTESDAEVVAALLDLLQQAREAGDIDAWNGKRGNPRYTFSPRLELLRDGDDESAMQIGTLYNVSRCGMALWSRQAYLPGSMLHIRVWPPNVPATWVPVRVEHCERGLRGFLIGASFPLRLPAEIETAIEAPRDSTDSAAAPASRSLMWYVGLALALTAGIVLARLF
jgi:hypothetical protein